MFHASPLFYPVWICLLFLLANIILYSFAAWYMSNVLPGEYGTGKKLWFFVTPSYWRSRPTHKPDDEQFLLSELDEDGVEAEIVLQNLSKTYPKSWPFACGKEDIVAVDELSFSIRKGEIFALLGHNGAGKSTTISMLSQVLQRHPIFRHTYPYLPQ